MFKILHAQFIAPGIKRFIIEAPRIARKHRPGQFVILRLYEEGERIPLTIEKSDSVRGTIHMVVQSIGKTTHLLNSLDAGDCILDVVGPLGKPSEIEKFGTVVIMGGGVGTGMCGGCRVLIDGKSEFACVDGPEFEAHRVDFAVLVQRNGMYRAAEKKSLDDFQGDRDRLLKLIRAEQNAGIAEGVAR